MFSNAITQMGPRPYHSSGPPPHAADTVQSVMVDRELLATLCPTDPEKLASFLKEVNTYLLKIVSCIWHR